LSISKTRTNRKRVDLVFKYVFGILGIVISGLGAIASLLLGVELQQEFWDRVSTFVLSAVLWGLTFMLCISLSSIRKQLKK
jgi:hypothetical protein